MGLYERLASANGTSLSTATPLDAEEPGRVVDPLTAIKRKLHQELLHALGPRLYDLNLAPAQLEASVREKLNEVVANDPAALPPSQRQRVVGDIMDDILGYGPISALLKDPTVTEVMANGADSIYVERDGKIERTDVQFMDDAQLRRTIEKIVGRVGRRIDESQPYVDARLPDGSRVNAVIPPVSIDGPALTIRKFSREPFQASDLVSMGTMTNGVATFLEACVNGRINILVSGGTGAGKTTTLNVLSSFIPEAERIITIEDAAELRLQKPHIVRMEYRPPNIEGTGEVTIRNLVRNALRMRPDRIVVGEVRGGESLDMLQAMNTGHDGSISTIHANGPRDALARLETMVLLAGVELPVKAIREQVASAIQVILHQSRLRDGTRRITHVTEVVGMEGQTITLQDLFLFDLGMGFDEGGRSMGHLKPTGLRPTFSDHLADLGVQLDPAMFTPEIFARRSAGQSGGR